MGAAEWSGYTPTVTTSQYGSPLPVYCDPTEHSSLHLPTVLPDSSCSHPHGEYTNLSPPGVPPYGGERTPSCSAGLTELEPLLTPRYPSDSNNGYVPYPNTWSSNGYNSYNNYQYNNSITVNNNPNLNCPQQTSYINPPAPTMVLYPHLYSTVNQNQIHLHLHGSTDKLDQYFASDAPLTISSGASIKGSIEIGIGMPPAQSGVMASAEGESGMVPSESDTSRVTYVPVSNVNTDPSSVWRPY